MTGNEIIYDIREKIKIHGDDIDIVDEYLFHLVNVKRALLLKQRFGKTSRNIPEEVKQIICVPMEPSNDIEGICDDSTLLVKSSIKIPNSIEIGGRSALVSVRTKSVSSQFINMVPIERFPNIGYNKYLKNQIYVAIDADNKLYAKTTGSPTLFEELKVTGVFFNPEEAFNLSCGNESENCEAYDREYPIESYIVSDLVNLIVQELASGLQIPEDKMNNADESNR